MHRTKPFMSGNSQAVRIPSEYRFANEELIIRKVGDMVLIVPVSKAWEISRDATGKVTDDFMRDREQPPLDEPPTL